LGHHRQVRDDPFEGAHQELRIRLSAEPVSVPAARRFVADGLSSWRLGRLADDATLCVSELAGNAALHSSGTFMDIAMRRTANAVRISVEDDGAVPAEALTPRPGFPDPGDPGDRLLEDEATTGRGLAIVSILASDWGVEETERGKRVWADIDDTTVEHDVRPPTTSAGESMPPVRGELPEGWTLVRLVGCPVRLGLRQDEHLDELIRELQLLDADQQNPRSGALALELQGLLSGPAHARHTGRRISQQAAEAGKETINVEMAMPREFSVEVQKLEAAVKAADVLCEEMRLLTLASSAELRELRAWMTEQITDQVERGADPVSWSDWLADRP
jgi:anti-sigma regulatory factor (Ser/Thr protein kinase)